MWTATIGALLAACCGGDSKYLDDFEFIATTVDQRGAAVELRKLDWAAITKVHKPRFEACSSDVEHVRNVMRLLAELGDSHTGVTRSSVDASSLPSKWDGLYGGGLWFAREDGRFMLRGVMDGHALAGQLPLGTAIASIDGWPAWLAFEREKRRITEFAGSSSDHSLFSSLGNRMLPFGARQSAVLVLVGTGAQARNEVTVPRWGPEGRAFDPISATLPPGVEWGEGAVSKMLALDWSGEVGYLRITGSMNDETVAAFDRALDRLRGAKAILLDCRGMGGGSDHAAWTMCGRFFPKGADNGLHGRIEASGDWQFEGPVVMLQDESEVSSAETFTWGMSETLRAVSVGRPTGGWGIIPNGFKCPSGLVDFRLGVNARPTPIRRVVTEGTGWPPDVLVPYGPVLCAEDDPVRAIGLAVLRVLHAGVPRDAAKELFADLFGAKLDDAKKRAASIEKKVEGFELAPLAELAKADLAATLELELELLESRGAVAPDVLGLQRRLDRLEARAKGAGLSGAFKPLRAAATRARAEAAAQEALLELPGEDFAASERERKAFLAKHGKTRLAEFVRDVLWKDDSP